MKRAVSFLFLLLCYSLTKAQFFQVAEGPVFPDPGPGYAKILQMKNNTTMFFHINFSNAMDVQVYEAQYKARTETNLEPAYGKLQNGKVESIFEINGNAVLMISSTTEDEINLYRLIIDGKTGELKEEKQIGNIKKKVTGKTPAKTMIGSEAAFHVSKDPASENYAVAMVNDFISDTSKRVEIIQYGADNKETKRSHYASGQKFKYLQYVDMLVIGTDKVDALIFGYNVKDNEKEGEMILAAADKGAAAVVFNELPSFSNDLIIDHGIARYNPQDKRLLLLMTASVQSDSGKRSNFLVSIDPYSKKLLTSSAINAGNSINKKYTELYKKAYQGIPQNLFINNDGSYTIIYEEMEAGKERDTVTHFALRNVAVATYDNEGEVKSSYLIPMDHDIINASVDPFYQSRREAVGEYFTGMHFLQGNQYKSSSYVSDGHSTFILFNDTEANAMSSNGKISQLKDVYNADGFYYKLSGNNIIPKAQYVFGKPASDVHTPGIFTVFDYDKANNVLITLKLETLGAHPGMHLVWLQPN